MHVRPRLLAAAPKDKEGANFIETFISDPSICRLYLGFSKLDTETAEAMRKAATVTRLKAYSHVLDFFGGMFEIRDGKAVVPGGQRAAAGWTELAGVSPDQGAAFFDKLMAKDDGWLASLYDALARIQGPVKDYLTDPARMKRFYTAVRGRITSPGPARPVFRANTDMMLFTTRLRVDANGKPHIPGSLEVWRNLFVNHPQGKYDGKLTKLATGWKEPDDVLEALFALSRKAVENEPLKIFMAISDIDRNRPTPLSAATVDRLAREYHTYGSQYALFSESRSIFRTVHHAVPGSDGGHQQGEGPRAALRHGRHLPVAGRPLADPGAAAEHSRRAGRHRLLRHRRRLRRGKGQSRTLRCRAATA